MFMHVCGAGKEGHITCIITGHTLIVYKFLSPNWGTMFGNEAPETLPNFISGQSAFLNPSPVFHLALG